MLYPLSVFPVRLSDRNLKRSAVFTDQCNCILQSKLEFEKQGQRHVFHCVTSQPLITLINHLGTEDTNYWSFPSGIFAHFCWMQNFSCSTVHGHHYVIIIYMMHPTFLIGDRSGLQTVHSRITHVAVAHADLFAVLSSNVSRELTNHRF